MSKNNYSDNNLDFLIKKAVMSNIEKDTETFDILASDTTIVNPNREELDRKIYAMIDEHFDKTDANHANKNRFKKFIIKVAVFVLILSSGFFIPFLTVEAFRDRVVNFYMNNFGTHTSFIPKEEDTSYFPFTLEYIPDGYIEGDKINDANLHSIIFYNNKNNIIDITLYDSTTSFNVDTEESERYSVFIKNKNGYIYRKESSAILIYKFHDNSIVITSDDSRLINEELIKIAESIK